MYRINLSPKDVVLFCLLPLKNWVKNCGDVCVCSYYRAAKEKAKAKDQAKKASKVCIACMCKVYSVRIFGLSSVVNQ